VKLLWKDAEITWGKGWRTLATGASPRDYHSSAVLLANGKVLTAGGDDRDWDYQLFSPPYLAAGNVRPTGLTLGTDTLGYRSAGDGPYTLAFDPLPPGITVARVVLMAPGSTTHHSDFGQRLVDLELVASGAAQLARGTPTGFDSVLFQPPDNHCTAPNPTHSCAPRGYYMLFAVTNRGVPSEALFVRLR